MCLYIRMAECVPLMFPIPSLPTRHVFIQRMSECVPAIFYISIKVLISFA